MHLSIGHYRELARVESEHGRRIAESLLSRERKGESRVIIPRLRRVSVQGLLELDERHIYMQFEWYREFDINTSSSQSLRRTFYF